MIPDNLKIVIPGGSGHVGTLLARHFHTTGHRVTVLSRNPKSAPWKVVPWNPTNIVAPPEQDWIQELQDADVCINLTGRSVNCRYNLENRLQIYDSRIQSTQLLSQVIASMPNPPRIWLNSSTATIYRHALDRPMDEAEGELGGNEPGAPDTWNFSIKVAKDWESAFFATPTPNTRKIAMRSAVTLSPDKGSIFDVLSTLVRRGLGGTNGNGNQMVSWVHGTDFIRAVEFIIANKSISGVVNIASPNPLTNAEFMAALREAWRVPIGLPAPAWLIEIGCFLMQTESELVLKSRWVIPGKLLSSGFDFLHPDWPATAKNLVAVCRKQTS